MGTLALVEGLRGWEKDYLLCLVLTELGIPSSGIPTTVNNDSFSPSLDRLSSHKIARLHLRLRRGKHLLEFYLVELRRSGLRCPIFHTSALVLKNVYLFWGVSALGWVRYLTSS